MTTKDRGTAKGDERAEELQELKDEADNVKDKLEELYQDNCVSMHEAILAGDRDDILKVLSSGNFALGMGFAADED